MDVPRFPNRFQNVERVGAGGNAVVFRALDVVLRRDVALKWPVPHPALDPHKRAAFFEHFRIEAQRMAGYDCENIVKVFDLGEDDAHVPFIIEEFVRGESLDALLREQGQLPEFVALEYAIQVARGLEYMHGKGDVHRDVKPANILIAFSSDRAKLSDFGIARDQLAVTTPQFTDRYAPYELRHRLPLSPSSDWYCFGATLFEMLAGQDHFEGEIYDDVPADQTRDALRTAGVSSIINDIVLQLMRSDPEERLQSGVVGALQQADATLRDPERTVALGPDEVNGKYGSATVERQRTHTPQTDFASRKRFGEPAPTPIREQHHSRMRWYLGFASALILAMVAFLANLRSPIFHAPKTPFRSNAGNHSRNPQYSKTTFANPSPVQQRFTAAIVHASGPTNAPEVAAPNSIARPSVRPGSYHSARSPLPPQRRGELLLRPHTTHHEVSAASPAPLTASYAPNPASSCSAQFRDAGAVSIAPVPYPKSALERNLGVVRVSMEVTVAPTGHLLQAPHILQSSGDADIDRAAVTTAEHSTYTPKVVDCHSVTGVYRFDAAFYPTPATPAHSMVPDATDRQTALHAAIERLTRLATWSGNGIMHTAQAGTIYTAPHMNEKYTLTQNGCDFSYAIAAYQWGYLNNTAVYDFRASKGVDLSDNGATRLTISAISGHPFSYRDVQSWDTPDRAPSQRVSSVSMYFSDPQALAEARDTLSQIVSLCRDGIE